MVKVFKSKMHFQIYFVIFLGLTLMKYVGAVGDSGCTALTNVENLFTRCECVYQNEQPSDDKRNKINCVNQNFTTEDSLRMLHLVSNFTRNLKTIKFTGNQISHLPPNLLGNIPHVSLWNMETLDLSNNGIEYISGKAFHVIPDLKMLILDDNEWKVSEKVPRIFYSFMSLKKLSLNFAFSTSDEKAADVQVQSLSVVFEGSELYLLEELYLERNSLRFVHSDIFQSLPSLRKISLRDNEIATTQGLFNATCHEQSYTYIPDYQEGSSNRLDEKCWLEEMDLYNNSLNTIDVEFIQQLMGNKEFKKLNIHENPLVCDCRMLDFHNLITHDQTVARVVHDLHNLTCVIPGEGDHKHVLKDVSQEKFVCGMPKSAMEHSTNAASIVMTILFVIVALVLVIAAIYHRETVKRKTGEMVMCARDQCCPRKYKYQGVNV